MILSVDTGLKNYALVVLDEKGTVYHAEVIQSEKTKKKGRIAEDYANRITGIYTRLKDIIDDPAYCIDTITGELPSFGAQSSNAAVSLTAGATIMLGVSALYKMPIIYASPEEIKESFTGDPHASKKVIMQRVCKLYGWDITYKQVKPKNKPIRHDPVYHVMGQKLSAGYFEHIADAIAAFHTCKRRLN